MKNTSGPNPLSDAQPGRREIRSFVLREGRLTKAQARALETLWPRFGIDNADTVLDFDAMFGRQAPTVVEIGFGNGQALAFAAEQDPDGNYLGIEVHRPGVGSLLQTLEARQLSNVRLICADATRVLARFPSSSLAGLRLYFPDPWPKKRHHKRRLVQSPFVEAVVASLAPEGLFHLATDWEPYAEHMLDVVSAEPDLRNQSATGNYVERPPWRPETRFERRGKRLGHGVWDLLFSKA